VAKGAFPLRLRSGLYLWLFCVAYGYSVTMQKSSPDHSAMQDARPPKPENAFVQYPPLRQPDGGFGSPKEGGRSGGASGRRDSRSPRRRACLLGEHGLSFGFAFHAPSPTYALTDLRGGEVH